MILPSVMLLEPLYTLFGAVLRTLYNLTGNYGTAILIYGIAVRILMMPLSVRSHKNALRQRALQPKLAELQRACGNDKKRYQQEMMELYKANGVSLAGGTGSMLLSILLMWPIYRVVSAPFSYLNGMTVETLHKIGDFMLQQGLIAEGVAKNIEVSNISLIHTLHNNPGAFADLVNQGLMKAKDLFSLNFLGIDLGLTPSLNPADYFGPDMKIWLPILLIIIINLVCSIFPQILTQRLNPMFAKSKQDKELAKNNPARGTVETQSAESVNKTMMFTMPLMMLMFSFWMPAAMTLYWIVGNLMMLLQTYLFYILYTKPYNDLMDRANSTSLKSREEVRQELEAEKGKKSLFAFGKQS